MTDPRVERILNALKEEQLSPQRVELAKLLLLTHQACANAEETGRRSDIDLARELKDRAVAGYKALSEGEQ